MPNLVYTHPDGSVKLLAQARCTQGEDGNADVFV